MSKKKVVKEVDVDLVIAGCILLVGVGVSIYFIGRRAGWDLCWDVWETYHQEVMTGTLTVPIFD